jgi:LysM repeat protein
MLLLLASGFLSVPEQAGAAFFKKRFVVRKDRGQDILCDPYVVQKGDFVTKLFKQRGAISHEDYPKFLAIFKRVNPDVEDIDRIFPGHRIFIPLKVLPPGTLMGQDTGTVTLPIIMISDLPELVKESSSVYEVTAGDTVWELIVSRFGGLTRKEYMKLKELVKYMNPQLEDLNRINIGDKLRIPESKVRNTLWYDAIFDEKTAKIVNQKPFRPETAEEEVKAELAVLPESGDKDSEEKKSLSPPSSDPAATADGVDAGGTVPVGPPGLATHLRKAARVLNAELMVRGDFFFPRRGLPDYRVILSRTPVMHLPGGVRLLFDPYKVVSEADIAVIKRHWRKLSVIRLKEDTALRQIFEKMCPAIDVNGCGNKLSFSDNGISVTVRGEYIFDRPGGDGKICLTFIDGKSEQLPVEIRRYLAHHWIVAADWIDSAGRFFPAAQAGDGPLIIENVIQLEASSVQAFAGRFLDLLGYRLQMSEEISFPYAGFRVNSMVHKVTREGETLLLLDFGDLKGEAVAAIEDAGYHVLQIPGGTAHAETAELLMGALSVQKSRPPLFWAADRRRIHNVSLRIPGFIVEVEAVGGMRQIMLPGCELPPEIQYFLARKGLEILKIR